LKTTLHNHESALQEHSYCLVFAAQNLHWRSAKLSLKAHELLNETSKPANS
jgi:hypothetical protein